MRVYLSPQEGSKKIEYNFNREVITAIYDGKNDTFDLSTFPNDASFISFEGIDTVLDINPIRSITRVDGILSVELINFIDENATEEEKFPLWKEV